MSDLTPSEETAYGIIGMLGNDTRFKSRMDELAKARQEAEDAKQQVEDTIAALDKHRTETDNYVNGKKAELAAAQQAHDKSSREASDRLDLIKSQMAEALRVREQNMAMSQALAARESAMSNRERLLKDQQDGVAARQSEAERGADLVRRQLAHIAQMPKQ